MIFRWRGSVYKLVYMDLAVFCIAYVVMSAVYHFVLTHDLQTYVVSYFNLFKPFLTFRVQNTFY